LFQTTYSRLIQIKVNPAHVKTVEEMYAPADHPVFVLVPPSFAAFAAEFYVLMGSPRVSRNTAWPVYRGILAAFKALDPQVLYAHNAEWQLNVDRAVNPGSWEKNELIPPPEGIELAAGDGSYEYLGGVNGGLGLGLISVLLLVLRKC